jgi:hypothetical protein
MRVHISTKGTRRVWPVSKGYLLLRCTWYYLCICRGSVLLYTRFCNCLLNYDYILHIVNFAILYIRQAPLIGTNRFDLVALTLMFDLHIENFNFGYNFWIVCSRTKIFHLTVPCHNTFPWLPIIFFVRLILYWNRLYDAVAVVFDLRFKIFNLGMIVNGICHSQGPLCFANKSSPFVKEKPNTAWFGPVNKWK